MPREDDSSGTQATLPATAGASRPGGQRLDRGDAIGRYLVIDLLGEGGMGVVYAAYDPELDRRVAIKFLRGVADDRGDARLRLQREAQAMARLRHVNVVGVHDVGVVDGRVFVAMDLIDGQTLRAWIDAGPRPWRTILGVLLQAGEGLAAAHGVGLVHRDFKPDNVLVDRHGRVCVADFGLAAAGAAQTAPDSAHTTSMPAGTLTMPGTIMGTPAYMAPEQFGGGDVTAAADIFAFCVTAHEALYGRRPFRGDSLSELCMAASEGDIQAAPRGTPVPRSIEALLRRGLQPDPAHRPTSMRVLLDELARIPGARRRRFVIAAAAVLGVTIAGVFAFSSQPPACSGAADDLAAVWNSAVGARVRDAFTATGLPYAADTADRVTAGLDRHAAAWIDARTDACVATRVRGEQSEHLLDLRKICLDHQRDRLHELIGLLERADAGVVERGVSLVQGLPPLEHCADADALLRDEAPAEFVAEADRAFLDERVAAAALLSDAGRPGDAVAAILPAAERARVVAGPRLRARVLRDHAKILCMNNDEAAADAVREAMAAAIAAGDERSFAEASACMIDRENAAGRDMEIWKRLGEAALARIGGDEQLYARMLLRHGVGLRLTNHLPEAIVAHRAALELRRRPSNTHPDTVGDALYTLANTLLIASRPDEGLPLLTEAIDVWRRTLGPDHPRHLAALRTLVVVHFRRGDLAIAERLAAQTLDAKQKLHGPHHHQTGDAESMLSNILAVRGDFPQARVHLESAVAIARAHPSEQRTLAYTLANLANFELLDGHPDAAEPPLREAQAVLTGLCSPPHPDLVILEGMLGSLALRRGQLADAETHLRAAVAMYTVLRDQGGQLDPDIRIALADTLERRGDPRGALAEIQQLEADTDTPLNFDRDRAAAAFVRARALLAVGDRPGAEQSARRAADLYAPLQPGYAPDRDALSRWQGELSRRP